MPENGKLFAMGAEFSSAKELYHAAEIVRDAGYKRWDVYSPFPIHGMDDAMGLGPSRLSFFSLIGGITGLLSAFALVYYTSYLDYPLVVQGKPYFAFEPTFPVFFELTILLTAFATIGALLGMNLLPRLNHPMFNWDRFSRVTDDGFFLAVEAGDPLFSEKETRALLEKAGGAYITLIHEDAEETI
ncbi:MAG: DUF3341 domain-containing protein [Candidatus Methylacidiphilales bacterium]